MSMSKKEERRNKIKEAAKDLFVKNNIEYTTLSQIAAKAGVGEATVYRHFANKVQLALEIAVDYADWYSEEVGKRIDKGSHVDQFRVVLDFFIELYSHQPDYFIYLEHFDDYVSHQPSVVEGIEAYEERFLNISRQICDIEAGEVLDDSVRKDIDADLATHTFSISFIALCQKMLLRGHVFSQDDKYDPIKALEMMRDMMIESLKA